MILLSKTKAPAINRGLDQNLLPEKTDTVAIMIVNVKVYFFLPVIVICFL